MLISHDRRLLERISRTTIWLDRGIHKNWPDPERATGSEENDAEPANGISIESPEFTSRPNDVPDGLQRFDAVGNDLEDRQEGHGKERAGNPPDSMPKEQ